MSSVTDKKKHSFYALDNAGFLYTAIASSRMSAVYRMSAGLTKDVDPQILQQALDHVITRFPYFQVTLKRGFFWYYYEHTDQKPEVEAESHYPCKNMRQRQGKTFPFRVLYFKRYIHLEFNHSLCDGGGGIIFLQTLLIEYFRLQKGIVPTEIGIAKDLASEVDPQEFEDSFKVYYKEKVPPPLGIKKVYHFDFELLNKGEYLLLTGKVPLEPIYRLAKENKCSITQYILALYMESIQDYIKNSSLSERQKRRQRIAINLPVDLRKMFSSITLRNFFISLSPDLDLSMGYYSREEIIEQIKGYMGLYMNKKHIYRYISRNIRNEKFIVLRVIPLWIKKIAMPIIYKLYGERGYTSGLSNLGLVRLPAEIEGLVDSIEVFPAPSSESRLKMVMISYKNQIALSFGKTSADTSIERLFFTKIRELGIPVKIETNKR